MTRIGKSDSQANAEALARRGLPFAEEHRTSVTTAWDYRRREPADLREAVHMVRKAYQDEVPTKLHEGYDSIGDGGTPKFTARAEGYIFGDPRSDDAARDVETGEREAIGYYHTPFRATLARLEYGPEAQRKRAAIVAHIAIGQQGPADAAMVEGVPAWCAKLVAEDALRCFLRQMSDMRVRSSVPVADSVTAA